ncbi:cholinesterase precursor [Apiospora saccharicola]
MLSSVGIITISLFALDLAAALIGTSARVNTTSGLVGGHQAANRTSVTEFLGIKYAAAPTGELRFAPPKRFAAPPGTLYEASNWFPNFTEPSGLRVWKNFAAQNDNPSSEDCLALNIWTKNPVISAKQPVLVWFHGGRFTIPGPHSPFFNGQYLADAEDIVVITVNYRLGIFGFSGAPSLPQNAALLDQRAAVEWIRDNIEVFGGDPSRITISGQSAGGASVDYYSFAWTEDPIVAGLIPQSGTSLSFLPNTPEYAASLWYNVSQTIGCGGGPNDSSEEASHVLNCVRAANVTTLLAAAAKVPALPSLALPQATFHPAIDNVTVFADYEARAAAGRFARIPMLTGNNDFEAGWYKLSAYAVRINLTEAQWDLYNERAFTCPSAYTANYRAQYGVPTWRYRYFGDWDNLRLYNGTAGLGPRGSGAYHGSEIEMVFGTARDVSGLETTHEEAATSRYMMGAWAAFARDPKRGLTGYGWPSYDPAGKFSFQM